MRIVDVLQQGEPCNICKEYPPDSGEWRSIWVVMVDGSRHYFALPDPGFDGYSSDALAEPYLS